MHRHDFEFEDKIERLKREMLRNGYLREVRRRPSASKALGKAASKLVAMIVSGAIAWSVWGDDLAERFPVISETCEKIGLSFCSSAEAMQEDEVLIEDETVEI